MSDHPGTGFSERVLRQIEAVEIENRRIQRMFFLAPALAVALVFLSWVATLAVGVTMVHLTIDVLARLGAVSQLERHLSTALLGPFAALPLLISLLLFGAALGWVRSHLSAPEVDH